MAKQINQKLGFGVLVSLFVILTAVILLLDKYFLDLSGVFPFLQTTSTPSALVPELKDFKKFASEEEFKQYLQEGAASAAEFGAWGVGLDRLTMRTEAMPVSMAPLLEKGAGEVGAVPERISETTVQVTGIDEPDIVKTDGKEIYFSSGYRYYPVVRWEGIVPSEPTGQTKVIKAFPPADLKEESKIEKTGDLLLQGNILVIFAGDKVYGYDASEPKSPQKKWAIELKENNFVVGARLYNGKIYLITRQEINTYRPCPIEPLSLNGIPLTIKCAEIYHPTVSIPVDVTYTALAVDPKSGETEKQISFVGSSGTSVLYVSPNAIYVTYSYQGDFVKFFYNFLTEEGSDIVPNWVQQSLRKLMDYEISQAAKMTEMGVILEKWQNTLSDDEQLKLENELTNRMDSYYKKHKRDLEKTGLAKIGLAEFVVSAVGNVPGTPLNQFSLDEYQSHLRLATTIGGRGGIFWQFGAGGESANDVYILDKNLKETGSVKDLGLTERIYSVRFLEDKGYVVTFRETDPFYVLDLSNPQNPEKKGELKIPGYSSYLHPITKDKILGIGKEGSNVKISLFDVANPAAPAEKAKYALDEYWSEILNNYHAFLLDTKHEIFFLPGGKGGYIFSYKSDKLKLERAVSDIQAKRAIYINDYLYIIGEDKITVLNELDWEKVNELELNN